MKDFRQNLKNYRFLREENKPLERQVGYCQRMETSRRQSTGQQTTKTSKYPELKNRKYSMIISLYFCCHSIQTGGWIQQGNIQTFITSLSPKEISVTNG